MDNHEQWQVAVLAQAAMFVACGVDLRDYKRMLRETGIEHLPIPTNFNDMGPFVDKIQAWAKENGSESNG